MGGRGSSSKSTTPPTNPLWQSANYQAQQQVRQAAQQSPQQQPANLQTGNTLQTMGQATATLATIMNMTDDQLAAAIKASKNVDMPNFVNDRPDATQRFVYQVGLNGAPTLMDSTSFQQWMQQNGISQSQLLARSVRDGQYAVNGMRMPAKLINDIFKRSTLNYIGGKIGNNASGSGAYFDRNGGRNTGYGSGDTMVAALNPATARTVDYFALGRQAGGSFARSHPKTAAALGSFNKNNASIYALAMGYNVITGGPVSSTYHNVIDRSALVIRDD